MKLTQLDLLEISQEISQCYAPKMTDSTPKLTLMPVAPKHLYAYWNLGNNTPPTLQDSSTLPLTLRIYSASDKDNYLNKSYEDFPMSRTQSQQDVFLSRGNNGGPYQASLGICFSDDALEVIADSNMSQLPQEKPPITRVKAGLHLLASNKEIKTSAYNNGSGQGIK
jgi:hypothetical protein